MPRIYTLIISLIYLNTAVFAQSSKVDDNKDKAKERWFQIELIIFARTDTSGLTAENWPDEVRKPDIASAYDFLTPPPPFEISSEENSQNDPHKIGSPSDQYKSTKNTQSSTKQDLKQKKSHNGEVAISPNINDVTSDAEVNHVPFFDMVSSELPYITLTDATFTLSPHAKVIKRTAKYRLLNYISWRQPVLSKSKSVPVRIFGGSDFAKRFNDDGYPLIKLPPVQAQNPQQTAETGLKQENTAQSESLAVVVNPANSVPDRPQKPLLSEEETDQPPSPPAESTTRAANENAGFINNGLPEFAKPVKHLWELDGTFSVYVKRYLHVEFNLVFNHEGLKEVDENQFSSFSNFTFPEKISDLGTANETPLNDDSNILPAHLNWNEVNDDNLLNFTQTGTEQKDSAKVKMEFLKPYLLHQKRRVRSKVIHYFDHPLIGVVMLITPYDPEVKPRLEDEDNKADSN